MPTEIYVLSDRLNNTVPIFQRVNKDQRVPIVKRPLWSPFLQVTCEDEEGVTHNLRYKESCPSIDMDEQVEKFKIPANAKYTDAERRDRHFINGICRTSKVNLQRYLKAYPGFAGSPYKSSEVQSGDYMLYDKANLSKIQNDETRKRVKAIQKVIDLDLEAAQALMIRLNGSMFVPPDDLFECQNQLADFIDAAEDAGLEALLKEESKLTVDEKTTILIGSAINAEILSFDKVVGKVSKRDKQGKWGTVRELSSEYPLEERMRLFSDFLNTDDGKPLKNDIEKDLKALNKK